MKIFIDSARLDEIEKAYSYGIIDGVTTNPSLLKKAVENLQKQGQKVTLDEYIKKILKKAKGTPVSLEVTEYSAEAMIKQAKKIYERFNPVANNVYIKIPVNPSIKKDDNLDFAGIHAIKKLSEKNIPVNCTLVFTPEQALLAAKAGAKFVSPFAGRIDDYIRKQKNLDFNKSDYYPSEGLIRESNILEDNGIVSGVDLIQQIIQIFDNYDIETEVLAASIRNVRQARESALVGADIATLPYSVIKQLLYHYKTMEAMNKFIADVIPEYVELTV